MSGREHFGSKRAVVLAMAGSAIGLGNIWRFPTMVGQDGGAVFILLCFASALLISIPIFLSESIIGRHTQSNLLGAVRKITPSPVPRHLALITICAPFIILSYYSVVGGWSIHYLTKSVVSGFTAANAIGFGGFTSSVAGPLVCLTVFLGATVFVVLRGVKKGIELFNKFSIPLLFILIVAIAIYSMTLPGAEKGLDYLIKPDFSKLTPKTVADAMGQSFFSLSLGVGAVLTYSSYMKKDGDIMSAAISTAFFDLVFALLAGLAVIPAVFAAGIEPGAGPGLVFDTLPFIFSKIGESSPFVARVISIVFFTTVLVAALTSSISLLEVGVAYLTEEKVMPRKKAIYAIFASALVLGVMCSLSFGPLKGVRIFGLNLFSFCDKLTANFMMTLGALLFVYIAGWKMKKETFRNEFTNGGTLSVSSRLFPFIYFLIKYACPVAIAVIFVSELL